MTAAVAEGGRYRRLSQKAGSGDVSGRCRKLLRVGAPGTISHGRKGRTRKEDKMVLGLYVDTKFVDRKERQCHEDTLEPFMSDNIGYPTSRIRRAECIYISRG
jgi:hypothetical protein